MVEQEPTALTQAAEIIHGDREKTYGHPSRNLARIAKYWQLYLDAKDPMDSLTVQDVCQMMALLKLARLQNDPDHHDSLVDAIGYLGLVDRCKHEIEF